MGTINTIPIKATTIEAFNLALKVLEKFKDISERFKVEIEVSNKNCVTFYITRKSTETSSAIYAPKEFDIVFINTCLSEKNIIEQRIQLECGKVEDFKENKNLVIELKISGNIPVYFNII